MGFPANMLPAPGDGFAITPDNETDLPRLVRSIWVGTAGDIRVTLRDGATLTFPSVPAGGYFVALARRVHATGTTAGGLIGVT